VFVLFKRHFPVWQANLLQMVIFVSFLWELGYQAWGPLLTIPFALIQGAIYSRTKSLPYVLTVHLLFDAIVFLVIVHARNGGAIPIFLL
jgi:membrane protease YdiL (CAAX protease family)